MLANLARCKFKGKITVFERDNSFPTKRTWGYWENTFPNPFRSATDVRFQQWRTIWEENETLSVSHSHPYAVIRGEQLYEFVRREVLPELEIEILFGEAVSEYREEDNSLHISTAKGQRFEADYLVVTGPTEKVEARQTTLSDDGTKRLYQSFYGEILKEQPARSSRDDSLILFNYQRADRESFDFTYHIPFSSGETLVEYTRFGRNPGSVEGLKAEFADWKRRSTYQKWEVRGRESGVIPMYSVRNTATTERTIHIGRKFGSSRPSSGYTFFTIQHQASQIAALINQNLPLRTPSTSSWLINSMDTIFLKAIEDDVSQFKGYLSRIFSKVPGDSLARFMMSCPDWSDLIHIVTALPKLPFMNATFRSFRI